MSRRSAVIWAIGFIVLALIGTGGRGGFGDLTSSGDDGSSSRRTDAERPQTGGARPGVKGHPSRDPGGLLRGRVIRVVDGDTVKVLLEPGRYETVRYIGVDTPESVKPDTPVQCFAKEASAFNSRLVQGREVRLRIGRERRDRYGRLLAYVYVTGAHPVFVNAALVRGGYARTLEIAPNTDRADFFARLESHARDAGRGLWAACE
jgi:micrococcal nuclease